MESAISSRSFRRRSLRPIASATMAPMSRPSRMPSPPVTSRRLGQGRSGRVRRWLQEPRLHRRAWPAGGIDVSDVAVGDSVRGPLGLGGGLALSGDRDDVGCQVLDLESVAQRLGRPTRTQRALCAYQDGVAARDHDLGGRRCVRSAEAPRAHVLVSITGRSMVKPNARCEAQHGENGDDELAPPQKMQGPSQIQRLVAHPASEWRPRAVLHRGIGRAP